MLIVVVNRVKRHIKHPVLFFLLGAAYDPELLTESDFKVIFVEVEVNFDLVVFLTKGVNMLTPELVEMRLIKFGFSIFLNFLSNPSLTCEGI